MREIKEKFSSRVIFVGDTEVSKKDVPLHNKKRHERGFYNESKI